MNKVLFSIINPVVKCVLRSPLHRLMSHNTVLLEFTGRKSGRAYSTPVGYYATGREVRCFTDRNNQWWRNLAGVKEIGLTVKGQRLTGKPSVDASGGPDTRKALKELLLASPRDASYAGVSFYPTGAPVAGDIEKAISGMIYISVEILDGAG